ncbi:MAG: hypothetical protein E7356_03035 [Clostridiales bacterium]|nr:hypothetical protein [Clostridiales bacterium]
MDIRREIAGLYRREQENRDIHKYLAEARTEDELRKAKDHADWNKMVIAMVGGRQCLYTLGEILDEIANIVGTDRGNIRASITIEPSGDKRRSSRELNIDLDLVKILEKINGDYPLGDMVISLYLNGKEWFKFVRPCRLGDVQKDGSSLADHIRVEDSKKKSYYGEPMGKYVIDDCNNVVMSYTIQELAHEERANNYVPGYIKQAILNINDRECGKVVDTADSAKEMGDN